MLGEHVLTIFLCIKRVRLNWNLIVNGLQSATYSSHGAPCSARELFQWLNTRMKVNISLWTIREYPKRHFRYLSDSGDTFLPLIFKWYNGAFNHLFAYDGRKNQSTSIDSLSCSFWFRPSTVLLIMTRFSIRWTSHPHRDTLSGMNMLFTWRELSYMASCGQS